MEPLTPPRGFHALVLEKDPAVTDAVLEILRERSYRATSLSTWKDALSHLRERPYPIAVIGDVEGFGSIFDAMKEIVMASPMTSLILLTDAHEKEIHEKAEGYGIIGHVKRSVPSTDLIRLLERFEEISRAIPS